jgi:transposase-like protein
VGRRGRNSQFDLESQDWKLLRPGVGTVAACRLLGIGRKTGYRWRAENGGLPPARLASQPRSGRYLSLLERQRIATLPDRGLGVREIARRLGRFPSTVSRKLRRHLRPHDRGSYDGDLAHARPRERSRRPRRPLLAREPELPRIVQDKLTEEWSPAQIAAHLRDAYPDRPAWHLCHETISQALTTAGKVG